jgi:hypothetical protein
MFDWLATEIEMIKTRRFHVTTGPADIPLLAAIEASDAPLPHTYKEFVRRFGGAKLYRQGLGYLVGVWVPPKREQSWQGEQLYGIGHYQSSTAYFKGSFLRGEETTPVFEGFPSRQVQVADSFEAWLTKRCKAARKTYKRQKWAEIVAGPPPLTPEERKVVEARRLFTWRVVGITPERDLLIEVHNGSEIVLPFLSIGVRRKDGGMFGGIWLPVSDIYPGKTALVAFDVYKKMVNPSEVELIPEPDPEPEDREHYWEFKMLSR